MAAMTLFARTLPLRLKLAYAKVLRKDRADYKAVWDALSPTEDLAMIGVAGTSSAEDFLNSGKSTAESLKTMLDIMPHHDVLEIGCGVGRIGEHLAPVCSKWVGCDISAAMLRHARKKLARFENIELVELTTSSLAAIADASVDRVYCSAVFMHLDEWDRFAYVREAYRVLRSGGACYFDNINLAGDSGWDIFQAMSQYDPLLRPSNISKTSTAEELLTYLRRASFAFEQAFPGSHWVAVTGRKP